jgi:hypothetical protein
MKTLKTLADLSVDPDNAVHRSISGAARDGLANGVEAFGDLGAIVWNARLAKLVGGNQRVSALQARYGNLELIRDASGKVWIRLPNGEQVYVRVVEWDQPKHAAAAVTANNPALQGVFTNEAASILKDIEDEDEELFDALRLDVLAKQLPEPPGETARIKVMESHDAPETAWVMIGIPLAEYGRISHLVEAIGQTPGVFCESTFNDERVD